MPSNDLVPSIAPLPPLQLLSDPTSRPHSRDETIQTLSPAPSVPSVKRQLDASHVTPPTIASRPTELITDLNSRREPGTGKRLFVFVEDNSCQQMVYTQKSLPLALLDDICLLLYSIIVLPVKWFVSFVVLPKNNERSLSVVPEPSPGESTLPTKPEQGWTLRRFGILKGRGHGIVQPDDIVAVLSSGTNNIDYNKADLVRVNKRIFRQYLKIKEQDEEKLRNMSSIADLMKHRRMSENGGSGGDLRGLNRRSSSDLSTGSGRLRRRSRHTLSSPSGSRFLSNRLRSPNTMVEDDEECLPFIREVWNEMQEEMDADLDDPSESVGELSERNKPLTISEYYITFLQDSIFERIQSNT